MGSEKYIWDLIELLPSGLQKDYDYFKGEGDHSYWLVVFNEYYDQKLAAQLYSIMLNNVELDIRMVILCVFEGTYRDLKWFEKSEPYGFHELFMVRGPNHKAKCNLVKDTQVLLSYLNERPKTSKDVISSLLMPPAESKKPSKDTSRR